MGRNLRSLAVFARMGTVWQRVSRSWFGSTACGLIAVGILALTGQFRPGAEQTVLLVGVLGMVAQGSDSGPIEQLAGKIRRFLDDEDVSFSTDDEQVEALYDAVGEMAAATRREEARLRQDERYRQRVYEITSDTERSDDEKIEALLELGCERLGVENGHVVEIDRDTGTHSVVAATGSDIVQTGTVSALSETYCQETITETDVFCVANAPAEGYGEHPGYEAWGIGCYIGGKVTVEDDLYGTVCFVNEQPREVFSHAERVFVDLLARWVSTLYERRVASERLQRERDHFRTLFENAANAIAHVELTAEGAEIRAVNPQFADLFGYDTPAGERLADLIVPTDRQTEATRIVDAARRGETVRQEVVRETVDGPREFLAQFVPVGTDGSPTDGYAVYTDISDQKERQRDLEETKRRLELALEGTDTGIWEWNLDTGRIRIDETLEAMLGVEPGTFEGTYEAFERGVHPDDRERVRAEIQRAQETDGMVQAEYRMRHTDGSEVWIESRGRIVTDDDGTRRMVGTSQDITDRKERERDLEETKRRLELALEGTNTGTWEWNLATDDVIFDETGERMFGLEPGEFEGTYEAFAERAHPEDLEHLESVVQQARENDEAYQTEFRIEHEDGSEVWIEARGRPVVDDDGTEWLVGINHDITDRKESERQLRRYKEYTSDILDAIEDVFYVVGPDLTFQRWNQTFVEATGYTDAEIGSVDPMEMLVEADQGIAAAAIQRAFESGSARMEGRIERKDGTVVPYEFGATVLENPDGESVLVGIGRDVTERREREEELSVRSAAIEGAIDGMAILDENGEYVFVNQAHADVYGYEDPDALLGESWRICYDRERVEWFNEEVLPTLEREGSWRGESVGVRADGSTFPQELSLTALEDERSVCIVRDVTDRTERQQELERTRDLLQQAGRIATVGGWELDARTDPPTLTVTDQALDIHELSEEEAVTTLPDALEFVHPEDRDRLRTVLEGALEDGEEYDVEVRLITGQGTEKWVRAIGVPFREDGEIVGVRGSIQDVTEQKERERQLEEMQARYRSITEDVLDESEMGKFIIDDDYEVVWCNRAVEEFFGIDRTAVTGREKAAVLAEQIKSVVENPEAFAERVLATYEDNTHTEKFECHVLAGDGREERWLEHRSQPIETGLYEGGRIEYYTDITERKRHERELERQNDLFAKAQEIAGVGAWEYDVTTETVYATAETMRIHGLDTGEGLTPEQSLEHYHPDDRPVIREAFERAIERGEPYDLELRLQPEGGEQMWIRTRGDPQFEDGDVARIRGTIQDITGRKERERELERTKDLLQQSGQIAAVGGWELDARTDPPEMTWTEETYRIHEHPSGEEISPEDGIGFYHAGDRRRVRQAVTRALENGESYDLEARLTTTEGNERWVHTIGVPVEEGGEIVGLRGSIQDITEQKERELALESLHEATRGLLGTETETDAAELVVESAEAVLDVEGIGLYLLDSDRSALKPVVCTDGFGDERGAPTVAVGGESPLWNAFVTGTSTVFDGSAGATDSWPFGSAVDCGLAVPIGDHGVFTVVTAGSAVDDDTRRLVETLVATAEAAFDRIDSETNLRERDAQLEAQNRRLRRQIQITDIIRRVDQTLIGASDRAEIERTVCDQLTESEDVAFAWIGSQETADEGLTPRAWAGTGQDYLDSVSFGPGGESPEPATVAASTGEPVVVGNVLGELKRGAWRKEALARDFQSVVSVPLTFEEYTYGVLTVYATEPDAFGDLERSVFAELGETIAHSINAVETRQALHAETLVELTLELDPSDDFLGRVATEADCEVVFEGLATYSETEAQLFFSVTDAAASAVTTALEELVSVRESRLVADGETALFEVTVSGELLPSRLVRHGASPRSIRVADDRLTAVVDVPTSVDVREFVEMLRESAPSTELVGRRSVERATDTRQELVSSLLESLTDRQLEVLRTAYLAGFFEWPRTSTGEDVAEMLEVSQPTVNRHVRLGQRQLFEQLFDGKDFPRPDERGE